MMRLIVLFAALMLCLPTGSMAQEPAPLKSHDFARLPILHEGRIKPLDSFARVMMRGLSGTENPQGRPAINWLADALFNPALMMDAPILSVDIDLLYAQAGLEPDTQERRKYYALSEIAELLQITAPRAMELSQLEPDDLTSKQTEFLDMHQRAADLTALMRSLSMLLPLEVTLPQAMRESFGDDANFNYYTLSRMETPLLDLLREIIESKGEDPEQYSDEERRIALLSYQMQILRSAAENNDLLKIIPGSWERDDSRDMDWFAPWQLLNNGQGSPASARYLGLWEDMALAYRTAGEGGKWQDAVSAAQAEFQQKSLYSSFIFELEIAYNSIKPYDWARGFYALAALALGLFMMRGFGGLRIAGLVLLAGAMATHLFGTTARVIILDRPPVGTLYESVLFVALICAFSGWIASIARRQDLAALAGAISALGLLFIAPVIVPEGETLEVLVAVLNTNFWLATHVTIITAGYGMCVLAACMAHFYMALRLKYPNGTPKISALYKSIYKISIIALLLTAVGTVLGGIWADQSWGRFWGWDPKENGALLIVLWLIWLQHGRLSGNMRDLAFMAGIGYLNVIVALAWFGVNLLNVGLHSYGFISGIAWGLGIFCSAETLILGLLWVSVRYSEKQRKVGNET
jgi:ABC-type transport system involved in cytochrome c biogenesis permease subunit